MARTPTLASLAETTAGEDRTLRSISQGVALSQIPETTHDIRVDPSFDAEAFTNRLRSTVSSFTEGALPPQEIDHSTADKFAATMRLSNLIGSMASEERAPLDDDSRAMTTDELNDRIDTDGLQQHRMTFVDVNTENEYLAKKAQLEREQRDRDIVGSMGFWEAVPYEILAGVLDPTSYLPVAGVVGRGGRLAQRVIRSPTGRVASIATGQAAASEIGLQGTQELRTVEESISNIAFATLLSSALGVGAHQVLERAKMRVERLQNLESDMADIMMGNYKGNEVQGLSAALVDESMLRNLNTGQAPAGRMLRGWERFNDYFLRKPFGLDWEQMRNPEVEMLNSPFQPVKRVALQLMNISRFTQDNAREIANPTGKQNVSDVIRGQQGRLATAQQATNELFRKTGGGRIAVGSDSKRMISNSKKYGSAQDMSERVYRAMINNDVDVHGDPEITALAKLWRKEVFNPILEQLQEAGILRGEGFDGKVLKTALSYVTRIYNKDAILRDKGGINDDGSFLNLAYNYFLRQLEEDYEKLFQDRLRADDSRIDAQVQAEEFRQRELEAEGLEREASVRLLEDERREQISDADSKLKEDKTREDTQAKDKLERVDKNAKQRTDKISEREAAARKKRADAEEKAREEKRRVDTNAKQRRAGKLTKDARTQLRRSVVSDKIDIDDRLNKVKDEVAETLKDLKKSKDDIAKQVDKDKKDIRSQRDKAKRKLETAHVKKVESLKTEYQGKLSRARALSDAKKEEIKDVANKRARQHERKKRIDEKFKDEQSMRNEAERLAKRTRSRILGETGEFLDYEVTTGVRGYEKSRSFLVEDKILADAGFLMTDLFEIGNRYSRTAGADAAMGMVFKKEQRIPGTDGKPGDFEEVADFGLEQMKRDLQKDVDEYIESLRDNDKLDDGQEGLIREQLARDLQVIDERVALIRGTFSSRFESANIDQLARAARLLNYFRLMGGTVLSSMADIGALALVNGFTPTVRNGVMPLLREYRSNWGKMWIDGDKLQRSEMRRHAMLAGANMELILNSRIAAMASIETEGSIFGLSQSFQREMSGRFSKISGITYWNSMIKQVAYNTTQARIIEDAVEGWGKLSKRERAWLSNIGIDDSTLKSIRENWGNQAKKDEFGIKFGRFEEWADKNVAEKFKAALGRETTNMIVTPERAELPTFYNTPHGQLMLQFRSHMLLSQAKIVNRNAQLSGIGQGLGGGPGYALGMTGMLMFGVMVDAMKYQTGFLTLDGDTKDKGENPIQSYISKWEDNPTQQLFNSLDRATIAPIFADLDGIMNKMTGLGLRGVIASQTDDSAFTEDGSPARFRNRSPLDVLAGPTAGLLGDLAATTSGIGQTALSRGEILPSRAQFKAFRRLLPGQNVPGAQQFGNAAEQYLGDQFDWPEPR